MAADLSDQVERIPKARWVEDIPYFTSSGVSAGMDMSLAVIAWLFGQEMAEAIANGAEYHWNRDPNDDPFHQFLNLALEK